MLIGLLIILLFLMLGEVVSMCIGSLIPGNVCGMILLFLALKLKWIKPESIKSCVNFLLQNMAFFFIPSGIGILVVMDQLKAYWGVILIIVFISTILTLLSVGKVMHHFEIKNKKHGTDSH